VEKVLRIRRGRGETLPLEALHDALDALEELAHGGAVGCDGVPVGIRDPLFARDADKTNAFSKLSRYETTIERGLYKALHELQRLQAARAAAGSVSPPLAVDVDISGIPEGDR
jgi:hypothetical protein